ncbi:4-hydroxybenzoate octaprenyltransferase [Alteromonas sp. a30]|uniref:4-hydroxybenzoate octaprenyltransferase n=1 Tax=Alteromonas sp. a30 TaxID=2730917 RepID=UPI00228150EC|nr:4-hydroxybenzoate octaprenyltransferase [Alteromonas sp. a30]MCY7295743.1 4-hydroxybenzoate octaprenyltransferase [Alteromonas sp. a30]
MQESSEQPLKQPSWRGYWLLMRADKPIGTYLLLWPTLWGLWAAADGFPPLSVLVVFVLGVYLMRAAGCVINDFADRKVDGKVKRTSQRPLVTGEATVKGALSLFFALVLVSFFLVLTQNIETVLMSIVAVLLAFCYPFMKRFTYLPQFVLGAAFSWAIPMGCTAILGSVPWWGWLLYIANLVWTVAYDTMYAMVDRDDDLEIGVKSTAILFGQYDKLIVGLLQILTLALLYWVAVIKQWGSVFFLSLLVAAGMFIYQQWLIRARERDPCFKAFLHNHYVGMVIFIGIFLDYLLR